MTVDPGLVYGPAGALVCLLAAVYWLSSQLKTERTAHEATRKGCADARATDAAKYDLKLDEARRTTEAMAQAAIDALKQAGAKGPSQR